MPMDDHHVLALCFTYNPVRPLTEKELEFLRSTGPATDSRASTPPLTASSRAMANRPENAWWPKHHIDNDFNVDWERQKTVQFSGLPGTWPQDSGMQETMGRVDQPERPSTWASATPASSALAALS